MARNFRSFTATLNEHPASKGSTINFDQVNLHLKFDKFMFQKLLRCCQINVKLASNVQYFNYITTDIKLVKKSSFSLLCGIIKSSTAISKNFYLLIVTSSAIDKMFKIFGPIFKQNESINFEPIFEESVNFSPIFEKKCKFWLYF